MRNTHDLQGHRTDENFRDGAMGLQAKAECGFPTMAEPPRVSLTSAQCEESK